MKEKIFKLSGEIDLYNLEEVSGPIQAFVESVSEPIHLIFDCSDLRYFNSTFIGGLANWHSVVEGRLGGKVSMINVNEDVYEILELVGLVELLNVETT